MLLSDPRLRFARDLIAHWTAIRRDGLVPFDEDLDPRALLPILRFLSIADLSQPDAARMELVGAAVRGRYAQDIRRTDWFGFISPERRPVWEEAKRLFVTVPCGAFYRFALSAAGEQVLEAESLSLPLRRRGEARPSMSISLTRDVARKHVNGAASAAPHKIEGLFGEFVDIGAGAPAFPS